MSKLVWDKTGERKLEYGVDHGVLYVQKDDGTYENGVVWNGLTGVTESPEGAEANDLYADNIKYASLRSAETFGGTIEAYQSPPEFDECDGMAAPAAGIRLGQQKRKAFGLVYRTGLASDTAKDIDKTYKIHIIYNATASPSEKAYETVNDSPDAITLSWEFDTTPVNVGEDYKPVSSITIDSTLADADALADLEDMLFGTDGEGQAAGTNPTLPAPSVVLGLFTED